MAPTQSNVLILSSNTGGGHRSAAQALENSFYQLNPEQVFVKIAQVLEEASLLTRNFSDLYNYLLRHHQDLMRYYYWFIQNFKPNESKLVIKSALKYSLKVVERATPDVIVSVHPMTQHLFAKVLRKLNLLEKIPLVTVVTDPCYGFWKAWACSDVERYFVATEDAGQQLVDYKVPAERIQVTGMPVHSRFKPVSIEEKMRLRHELGLDPEKFTVFLNAGWIGGGNVPSLYEALTEADLDIQAVFLAGHNEQMMTKAQKLADKASFSTKVLGYTSEMEQVMNASDFMVSKLGGLTTFEALSCQLPILVDGVTPPMPQEAKTTDLVIKSGAGLLLNRPDEIVSTVKSLLASPEHCDMMRQSTLLFGKAGASDLIAKQIMGIIPNEVPSN